MSEPCDKHKKVKTKIICKCVYCEIDNLNQRVREQEEVIKWYRDKHKGKQIAEQSA
jgi:hypothetical protein